ncbi:MAG: FAD-dependent oxidoreductase [Oscillospiraceae bacterium]|jgi:formate dehydrogenase major subunit|nr:FAD-dependent oxidoreductase [Oscillospiraceae bacterium]
MGKLKINIDGRELSGFKGQTILEVALENGIQIPSFCFDKRMDTFGSCGICVVEAEGAPKLLRACATEISDGMVIRTDTPRVRDSRKANLELLLSQHTGDCRAPCGMACPAQTDCQGYVGLIANGEMEEALKLIKSRIPLAASIGRVCPHPCEDECRRKLADEPISILNLKRYAADIDLDNPEPYLPNIAPATGKSVGIVGGGPGGLSCAYFLAEMGHSVTVYDAMPKMGGMLRYGIPQYRLPKEIVDKEASLIEKMGVEFRNSVRIGSDMTFDSLKKAHDAMVIAIGAWKSLPLRCPGAELPGVYGGIEFLRKVFANEPVSIGKSVAVVGGGNTAMDACRSAVRLGAEKVYIIYRRTKAEMPADEVEIIEAEEEGVIFKYLVNPLEIIEENGKASKLRLQKMRLGEPDDSGRRRPEPIEGDEEILEADTVITALGQGIVPEGFTGIKLTRGNTIIAGELVYTTNEDGVFAIGDCINDGAAIAIKAIGDAKKAAASVDGYLSGIGIGYVEPYRVMRDDLTEEDFADRKKEPRSHAHHLAPAERSDSFFEIMETFDTEAAKREAARCLECGCHDFFECKLISLADRHNVQPDRFKESVPKIEFKDDHPFILRDPNKCILCGLCVRICDEIVGSAALGFVNRGFDTIVKPAFEDALRETDCVSCGQCVTVCPTGALQERITIKKPIPADTVKTGTICGMCAVGCSSCVESLGGMLVRTVPAADRGINGGVMCGRGRFGMGYVQQEGRITTPMVRKQGELTPVNWQDAFVYAAKKMESLKMRGEKIAVSIGQTYCIEDAGAVKNLAKLFGAEIFSFANRENGLASVLGYDGSPNTLGEILGCDSIFVFGREIQRNPVILSKLRAAVKLGASVTVVSCDDSSFNLPCKKVGAPDTTGFIKQVLKALIDSGNAPRNAEGYVDLKESLSKVKPGDDAKALAESYKAARKAMILFALNELSTAAATELANMAVIAGHIGSPRNGIYMLRQMSGSQTLADYGIAGTAGVAEGSKGLMMFGEDFDVSSYGLAFLMVQDTHMTDTAKKADVVFPLAAYPEIDGAFVNTERRLQKCKKAVEPPMEYRTSEIVQKIAEILEGSAPAGSVRELYPKTQFGECGQTPVLCVDGFGFSDKKAKLQVAAETAIFEQLPQTNYLMNSVLSDLPRPPLR